MEPRPRQIFWSQGEELWDQLAPRRLANCGHARRSSSISDHPTGGLVCGPDPPHLELIGGTIWLHCACVAAAERFGRPSSAAESYKYAGRRRSFCYLNFKFARDRFVSRTRPLAKRARFLSVFLQKKLTAAFTAAILCALQVGSCLP